MLADRIVSVPRSPFYSIMELAAKRDDCIFLHLGEPDFVTPKHIMEALKNALDAGNTHYGSDRGAPELRQALAAKFKRDSNADYDWREEILVTAGGQAALHIAVMALVNPGEEIIILLPHYPPYVVNATLAGAKAVFVKLKPERGFVPEPAEIEAAITPKTKAMIILTPNNPTGAVYPAEVMGQILEIAQRHNVTIISDETYEALVFDGLKHTSMLSFPGAKENVVLVSSFSKTYAMTGLRCGYLAAPREKLLQFLKYHHTVNISANVPTQLACAAALNGPQTCVDDMRAEYQRRRDLLIPLVNDIPGVRCAVKPNGAFFVFADIRELGMPSLDFVQYLVREAGVVLTNGTGFDYEGFVRISYATKPDQIVEAMARMKKAVLALPAAKK